MSAIKCPICRADAKPLPHTIDAEGFDCAVPTHGKFVRCEIALAGNGKVRSSKPKSDPPLKAACPAFSHTIL